MGKQANLIQYTIRGVSREVDRALRQKAARAKKSLNQLILEELTEATIGQKPRGDFSDLTGRWVPDPAFDEIIATQRRVDWEKWK